MDFAIFNPDVPGPANISPFQVALGAAVIFVNAIISASMKLGLEKQLLIGAAR
jgi:ABC-type iron transport system FetAB permease component